MRFGEGHGAGWSAGKEGRSLGYSKLTYEEYIENPEFYLARGILAPKWANELYGKGYKGVCAIDFYDDIFGGDLEEHRMPEDYRTGEYAAIAIEQVKQVKDGKGTIKGRRITVTQDQEELYDLIEESENFCMIAPISYAGRSRKSENARYLYALVIEVDGIKPKSGLTELIYSWSRRVATMPQPTYIVCSGNGVHLYFVFERPVPLFKNIYEQLTQAKRAWTRVFWSSYVSELSKSVQYESLNQPFRCVGTITKNERSYAMAFRTGEKVTLEYLNSRMMADNLQLTVIYKSNLPRQKAKELYPEWYRRRIEEGQPRGHWTRYQPIYYNWIEKVLSGAKVGHRYNCLENLCSLAVQCNIEPEQVESDCRRVAAKLEELTVDEDNHFTEYDILCALRTYHTASEQAYRRRIDIISDKTGIPLTANKRRKKPLKRDDGTALQVARMIQNLQDPDGEWRNKDGRPNKAEIVRQWRLEHPDGKKSECIKDTGLSKTTVYKWWS